MTTPAPTVFGVPLEAGERVVYFHRDDPGWQKPFLIVLGILMLIGFVGIIILIAGLMASTTVYVVTTRRFVIVDGKNVSSIRHGEVRNLTKRVAGSIVKWVYLSDGRTRLSWQAAANPRGMADMLERYVTDPRAVEQAESVPFESVPGPRVKSS